MPAFKIVFTCKDQQLCDWYEKLWRSRFEAELNEYLGMVVDDEIKRELTSHWADLMSVDAVRQHHYDFKEVDGKQVVLGPEDLDGATFRLLYPTIEIREEL